MLDTIDSARVATISCRLPMPVVFADCEMLCREFALVAVQSTSG